MSLVPPDDRTDSSTSPPRRRRSLISGVAGWSARRPWTALLGWLVLVVLALVAGAALGGNGPKSYDPGESGRAQRMIDQAGPNSRPPSESVLIQARAGSPGFAADPALRQGVADTAAALRALPGQVTAVVAPTPGRPRGLVSSDGRSALVTFELAGPGFGWDDSDTTVAAAQRAVARTARAHPGLKIVEAGDVSVSKAVQDATHRDFSKAELTSVPLTLVILLVVFGAVVAAGIPLLLSITAVAAALGLMQLAGRWIPLNSAASSVVLLVGMAVGVDYSLFYLRRVREERGAGRGHEEALRTSAATSGRAVAVSGLTVMISMAGLLLTGVDTFKGMTAGTITVVLLAVVGSLTALPALLSLLGGRVDTGRIPWLGRNRAGARSSRVWTAVVSRVVRKPLLWGGSAVLLLGITALPMAGMRLADPSPEDRMPHSIPQIADMIAIQRAFPGSPAPAIVVATGSAVHGAAFDGAVARLHTQVAASGGALREPVTVTPVGRGNTVVVYVPLAGNGSDARARQALAYLREKALPPSLGTVHGLSFAVTGETAVSDFAGAVSDRTPMVFAFILVFSFLLLVAAFRSLAIPLASIALNLLSIGAAYGVVTWIFQDGHGSSLVGFQPYGGVISWLPLFMFVLLFGLSMDYHVFILSRIKELRTGGTDGATAIVRGIGGSAGVVTSAAVVMIAVFSVFATLSAADYKMLGVGMATAVLIDATVVRGVLLPAVLQLVGERGWALPRVLRWVPRLSVEADPVPLAGPPVPAPAPLRTAVPRGAERLSGHA